MDADQLAFYAKLKSGDRKSFITLFEQYHRKIFSLAYRMTGQREDAEDVTQNTFIQAYQNIAGFNQESDIYTWLYAIAKNLCLRLLGTRRKTSVRSLDDLIHTAPSPVSPGEFSAIDQSYYVDQVREGCLLGLLRCLPFYQRIAFILHVLLDVKIKHVAAILCKSEDAVRILVHRARRKVKDFLCSNCSLYVSGNPCRCENLIHFSLKNDWIQKASAGTANIKLSVDPLAIEQEIDDLKRIISLYSGIGDGEPPEHMIKSVRSVI